MLECAHNLFEVCWIHSSVSLFCFSKLLFGSLVQAAIFFCISEWMCVCVCVQMQTPLNVEYLKCCDADTVNIIHKIIRTCCWIFMSWVELLSLAYKTVFFLFFYGFVVFKRFTSEFLFSKTLFKLKHMHFACTQTKSSLISDTSLLSSLHLFPLSPLPSPTPPPLIISFQRIKKNRFISFVVVAFFSAVVHNVLYSHTILVQLPFFSVCFFFFFFHLIWLTVFVYLFCAKVLSLICILPFMSPTQIHTLSRLQWIVSAFDNYNDNDENPWWRTKASEEDKPNHFKWSRTI